MNRKDYYSTRSETISSVNVDIGPAGVSVDMSRVYTQWIMDVSAESGEHDNND